MYHVYKDRDWVSIQSSSHTGTRFLFLWIIKSNNTIFLNISSCFIRVYIIANTDIFLGKFLRLLESRSVCFYILKEYE